MNGVQKTPERGQAYPFTKLIVRVIPLLFKNAPWHSALNFLFGILHGISWTAGIIATQILFDAISRARPGGFMDCLFPLLAMAGITFCQQIINGIHNFHAHVFLGKAGGKIKTLLHGKLQRIDPALFEDTAFLDDLNKAKTGAGAIAQFGSVFILLTSFYGFYFASIGTYLYNMKPLLLFTLLIAFFPALFTQVVRAKIFTKLEEENAPLRRKYEYYQKTLCDREYYRETRVLGAFRFFHRLFSETMLLFTNKIWQAERKTAILQLLLNITTFAGMAFSAYILFSATMTGEISVGAFAAVFAALGQIFYIMQEIVNQHIGAMNTNIGKVTNFIRTIDMPEFTGAEGNPDYSKGIVTENAGFTYPGRESPAVNDVSLKITEGETIAIVGENGAGKSTLVRLLTGIYRPTAGKVTAAGMDTAEISPKSIYGGISGVFQKYQRYKMTLRENIEISDTDRETDSEKIKTALKQADAETDAGLDDMLSPEFDGIDLSGGQWQRLAIARGLYRTHNIIVLDEPTSAIDPIEETRIYEQFQRLAQGKTAVVVTHRLGSARLANRIVVMDSGRIVDAGTHDELLSRPGKYADMWAAQAKWYER